MSDPEPLPETIVRPGDTTTPPKQDLPATIVRAPDAEDFRPIAGDPAPRAFGDYELLGEIARGGMGVVYKARHTKLNRTVALKMILAGQLADESAVRRFYNEAESAARLKHPHIVAIHDVGFCEGQHYFSMEFVEGQSLAERIRQHDLTPEQGAALVRSIALAIHYAHGQGVLHRDLKPGNVLLDGAGEPRVTDFGLAKQLEGDGDLTATGMILGSPNYMSPEQAMARHDQVGPASDIYALGAILFETLTGKPPFSSNHLTATLFDVIHTEPPLPRTLAPETPRDLETICLKCLAKEPRERYSTAAELAVDLDLFLRHEPINARPLGWWERLARSARRSPFLAVLYGSAGLFYLFHLASFLWLREMSWAFHITATVLLGSWVAAGTVLYPYLQSPGHRLWAAYGIMLSSILVATCGLSLDRGPASAPAFFLMLVIAAAPLILPSARLVIFSAVTSILCYACMAGYAGLWKPDNAVTIEQFIAFVSGQLALGLTTYLWVRGVRVVSAELSGSQATPVDLARGSGQAPAAKTVVRTPSPRT